MSRDTLRSSQLIQTAHNVGGIALGEKWSYAQCANDIIIGLSSRSIREILVIIMCMNLDFNTIFIKIQMDHFY